MADPDAPGGVDAPHARHALVHDHQVRGERVDGLQRLLAGRRLADEGHPGRGGDEVAQHAAEHLLVVDDEHAHRVLPHLVHICLVQRRRNQGVRDRPVHAAR